MQPRHPTTHSHSLPHRRLQSTRNSAKKERESADQSSKQLLQWKQASRQMSQQLELLKVVYARYSSHEYLRKVGKSVFKLEQPISNLKKEEKRHIPMSSHQSRDTGLKKSSLLTRLKSHGQLKQFRERTNIGPQTTEMRKPIFQAEVSQEHLLKQERPILRIGANMQFEQKLMQEHIANITKVINANPTKFPIVFCIKDIGKNITGGPDICKEEVTPICISIFPQSFDPKKEISRLKRQQYFADLMTLMHNTYDPEIMSRMPLDSNKPFDMANYKKLLAEFMVQLPPEVDKKVRISAQEFLRKGDWLAGRRNKLLRILNEVINNYVEGNAAARLDYHLKTPFNLQKSNYQTQYLLAKKRSIMSFRVVYHGGYSKSLYSSWEAYITNGRNTLQKKLNKYWKRVQNVNGWLNNFTQVNLFESEIFNYLCSPLSLDELWIIESSKAEDSFGIIQNLCLKGIMTILEFESYLLTKEGDFSKLLAKSDEGGAWRFFQQGNEESQTKSYVQYLKSRHSLIQLQELEQLLPATCEEFDFSNQVSINKSVQILFNNYFTNIVTTSINTLIEFFSAEQDRPIVRLSMKVDRQSLKLQETEDAVMKTFTNIITNILKHKIGASSIGMEILPGKCTYPQFGHLFMAGIDEMKEVSNRSSECIYTSSEWLITGKDWNQEDNEKKSQKFLMLVRENYRRAQAVMQSFSIFMPFIKLTAKEKIFSHEVESEGDDWEKEEEGFLLNKQKIAEYRQSLEDIPQKVVVGMFEVNCQDTHRVLLQRISQIDYLLDQRFLSKIFHHIHEMEQELTKIRTVFHSYNLKRNSLEQIWQAYLGFSRQLRAIKSNTHGLGKRILFYASIKAKSQTLIARYSQLITKRKELGQELKGLMEKVKDDSCYQQMEQEEQKNNVMSRIICGESQFKQILGSYFDLGKLDKYLTQIEAVYEYVQEIKFQVDKLRNTPIDSQEQVDRFAKLDTSVKDFLHFWKSVSNFLSLIRQSHHFIANDINPQEYRDIVEACLKSRQEYFRRTDHLNVNEITRGYLSKISKDLEKHQKLLPYLEIVTNKLIPEEYYHVFGCQIFVNISFRDLLSLVDKPAEAEAYRPKLEQLSFKAIQENEILSSYSALVEEMMALKVQVVDVCGSDTISREATNDMMEKIEDCCFKCLILVERKYSDKHRSKIEMLRERMETCIKILSDWLAVEKQFLVLGTLYTMNEDAVHHKKFQKIAELHRRIMKSLDMDNSVWQLPPNKFLVGSIPIILENITELNSLLYDHIRCMQISCPRLYFLSKEEIIAIMGDISLLPAILPKCLPTINTIAIKDDSIQRLGGQEIKKSPEAVGIVRKQPEVIGNYLILSQPLQISNRLSNVTKWLEGLLAASQDSLKNYFRWEKSSSKNCPLQILQLKEELEFTASVQKLMELELLSRVTEIQALEHSLMGKITDIKKGLFRLDSRSRMRILHLILLRDRLQSISNCEYISENSFEWLRLPRFYGNQSDPHVVVKIVNSTYDYGFRFIEDCSLIIQDTLFVGNCVMGKTNTGRKSLIAHHAYLTGNQLFTYSHDTLSLNRAENITNYFQIIGVYGSWLSISQVDKMSEQDLSIMADCFESLTRARESANGALRFYSNDPIMINKNFQVFFTLERLEAIPLSLAQKFKLIWIVKPSVNFLINLYLEVDSQPISEIESESGESPSDSLFKKLDFLTLLNHEQEVPLQLADWVRTTRHDSAAEVPNYIDGLQRIKYLSLDLLSSKKDESEIKSLLTCTFSYVAVYLPWKRGGALIKEIFAGVKVIRIKVGGLGEEIIKKIAQYLINKLAHPNENKSKTVILFDDCLEMQPLIGKYLPEQTLQSLCCQLIHAIPHGKLTSQRFVRLSLGIQTFLIGSKYKKKVKEQTSGQNSRISEIKSFYPYNVDYCKILDSIFESNLNNLFQEGDVEQIRDYFEQFKSQMTQKGFRCDISFVFAVGWILGNWVPQKKLLNALKVTPLAPEIEALQTCANIRQLVPQGNHFWTLEKFADSPHPLLTSMKMVSLFLKNQTVVFEMEEYSYELSRQFSQPDEMVYHLDPNMLDTPLAAHQFINSTYKKIDNPERLHFVVHSGGKLKKEVIQFLCQVSNCGESHLWVAGQFKLISYRQKFRFTFFVEKNQASLYAAYPNVIVMKITHADFQTADQLQLSALLNGQNLAEPLAHRICRVLDSNKIGLEKKYFWFQLPIRAALLWRAQAPEPQGQLFNQILLFTLISVPEDRDRIINEVCYRTDCKGVTIDDSLVKLIEEFELKLKVRICSQLVQIRLSLTISCYLYEQLYKVYIALSCTHSVIFHIPSSQTRLIIELAARIMDLTIVEYSPHILQNQEEGTLKKQILIINEDQISQRMLISLEGLIDHSDSWFNQRYLVVIRLSGDDDAKNSILYADYPFLKKYFLHVRHTPVKMDSLGSSVNLVETLKQLESGVSGCCLSSRESWKLSQDIIDSKFILAHLAQRYGCKEGYNINLLDTLWEVEEDELNKYRFYRMLTEQLFFTIDQMTKQAQHIPQQIAAAEDTLVGYSLKKQQIEQKLKDLQEEKTELTSAFEELLEVQKSKKDEYELIEENKRKAKEDAEARLSAIYDKYDNFGVQDMAKLRQTKGAEAINLLNQFFDANIKEEKNSSKKVSLKKLKTLVDKSKECLVPQKEAIKRIVGSWKKEKLDKLPQSHRMLYQWVAGVDNLLFKVGEDDTLRQSNSLLLESIRALDEKVLQSKIRLNEMGEYQVEMQEELAGINKAIGERQKETASLAEAKKNIEMVVKFINENQFKYRISKDLSSRLYFSPKISLQRSLAALSLNQFNTDLHLINQLHTQFIREEAGPTQTPEAFKFGLPMTENIFEDFEPILKLYEKMADITDEITHEDVSLVNNILKSRFSYLVVTDPAHLITPHLLALASNSSTAIINIGSSGIDCLIRTLETKKMNSKSILVTGKGFRNESDCRKFYCYLQSLPVRQNIKIVFMFREISHFIETENFQQIMSARIVVSFGRWLSHFHSLIVPDCKYNHWSHFSNEAAHAKRLKTMFQRIEKFDPNSSQTVQCVMEYFKKLQELKTTRDTLRVEHEEYMQCLSSESPEAAVYYALLLVMQQFEKKHPVELFYDQGMFANFCRVMRESENSQIKGAKDPKKRLSKFLILLSYSIKFINHAQIVWYCLISAFFLHMPSSLDPFLIISLIQEILPLSSYLLQVQVILSKLASATLSSEEIQNKYKDGTLINLCEGWISYFIVALQNQESIERQGRRLLDGIRESGLQDMINEIQKGRHRQREHYYQEIQRLDLRGQQKTMKASRMTQRFWVVMVEEGHDYQFIPNLEAQANKLKEDIRFTRFFFNLDSWNHSCRQVARLCESGAIVYISNIHDNQQSIIDKLIESLEEVNCWDGERFWKIFVTVHQRCNLNNRERVEHLEWDWRKNRVDMKREDLINTIKQASHEDELEKNAAVIQSLDVIVKRLCRKLPPSIKISLPQLDAMIGFFRDERSKSSILLEEGNVLKYLKDSFRIIKVEDEEIMEYSKLKQPLDYIEISDYKMEAEVVQLSQWRDLMLQLDSSSLNKFFKAFIKKYICQVISTLLEGQPHTGILDFDILKNLVKFGWIRIQNAITLKFFIYNSIVQWFRRSRVHLLGEIGNIGIGCEFRQATTEDKKSKKMVIGLSAEEFRENFIEKSQLTRQTEIKCILDLKNKGSESIVEVQEIDQLLNSFNIRFDSTFSEQSLISRVFLTYK